MFGFRRNKKTDNQAKETNGSLLRQLMYGHVVSSDFFARNWMALMLLVVFIVVYIAGKYTCQTKMGEVRKLNVDLETVRAERIRVRSQYMGRVRESAMQEMVDTLHLGLKVHENPPYILK